MPIIDRLNFWIFFLSRECLPPHLEPFPSCSHASYKTTQSHSYENASQHHPIVMMTLLVITSPVGGKCFLWRIPATLVCTVMDQKSSHFSHARG